MGLFALVATYEDLTHPDPPLLHVKEGVDAQ
jgi:hypothetical protein